MGTKQSHEAPVTPELDRNTNRHHHHHHHHHHRHSPNSNAAAQHHREQELGGSAHPPPPVLLHALSRSYPHHSHHRYRDDHEVSLSGGPSSSMHSHTHTHRSQDRRQHQYSHSRPDYVGLDFTMPSLDQRLVPRPRSVPGTHDTRRHRTHDPLSSSAPSNSLLFVRALSSTRVVKCPLCSKEIVSSELEIHLLACMSKPRVMYNVDTLTQDGGECSICLDDMITGDEIARLPCLCIYHVKCLQQWYTVSQTCPEHPESNYSS